MNTPVKKTDKSLTLLLSGGFIFFCSGVSALDAPSAEEISNITANWACKWCPYPDQKQSEGEVTAGAGYVSNDSYKQGDYTGRDEKGAYLIGGLEYDYRTPEQTNITVQGAELGTDARNISIEGRAGQSSGGFSYSELPHLTHDTARTPYRGDAHQQLPAGWVAGSNTQNMTQLASALRDVDVYTQRKTFSINASYQQNAELSYDIGFQRDTKEGKRTAGLAIGNSFATANSAILAIPVDYETNQGEVKANYSKQNLQASVSYQFSSFDNGYSAIRWDNAYSTPATATEGQAALEPDNTMWKIALKSAFQFSPDMFANLLLAYGQMEQNQDFLPYTINGSLATFPLPANSLDGEITTIDAVVNFHIRFSDQLGLQAKYLHNEQDNDTGRYAYDYIIADTQVGTPRANLPYSFRKVQYRVSGNYRIPQHQLQAGIKHEVFDRTYQEVDTTNESTVSLSYRTDMIKDFDIQLRGAKSERDGDKYQPVADIVPAENPLLRKYNLADRDREQLGASLTYNPQSRWHVTAYLDAYKDLYSNSELGLLESIQEDYGVALHYRINKTMAFNIDYSITDIESTQAGSASFSVPTWYAVNQDQIDVINFSMTYDVIPELLNMRFEYSYAESEGDIKVSTDGPLPTLSSTRHTYLLQGDYRLNKQSLISAFYRYEDYDESDWAIDNVNPDSIARVLSLGESSPSYQIGIIGAAIKYRF